MDASDKYADLWHSQPLMWRIKHRVWWRALTILSALTGGVSPGERMLLNLLKKAHAKSEVCDE